MINLKSLGGCKPMSARKRFEESYIPEPNSGCWLWLGCERGSNGYGSLKVNGKSVVAHRYSWEIHHGPIPSKIFVCHKCDNPACVNPKHLFLGSPSDNINDMVRKGRMNCTGPKNAKRGEQNWNHRLTSEQVIAIRNDLRPQRVIAQEYGVTQAMISSIVRRKSWRHL